MARNLPPRRTFVTRPLRRPALGVQQNRVVTIMGEADYTGSTLTSSVFALTANGSATTTLEATVYRNGVLASGEQVTYTVQRIQMSAADSFVSANPSDIDSDGVATSTITVQAAYNQNGDYISLPGIPAASVVLAAATTTGNTLTQPATATNANGVTTGTLKTTDAATSKTVSATIAGLAVTDTAVITTDGGYVPPPPGDPFFEDSFESGSRTNANGFTWGSTGSRVAVSNTRAYNGGTYSLRFRYGPDADGVDSSAEQRFDFGQNLTELWIEYYMWIPVNWVHRNSTGPDNNKFLALWANNYSTVGDVQCVLENYRISDSQSNAHMLSMTENAVDGVYTIRTNGYSNQDFLNAADKETWQRVRIHYKLSSGSGVNDGVFEGWLGNTLMWRSVDWVLWYTGGNNFARNGYLFGWSNSGYTDETDFFVDDFKVWDTDPQWTGLP